MKRGVLIIFVISLSLNAGVFGAAIYHKAFAGSSAEDVLDYPAEKPDTISEILPTGSDSCKSPHSLRNHPGSHLRWTKKRLSMLSRKLRLDSDQKVALQASLAELEAAALPTASLLREERRRLRRLVNNPNADAGEIRHLIRRVSHLQNRVDSLATEGMLREMKVLRPEQRMKYQEAFRGRRHGQHSRGR